MNNDKVIQCLCNLIFDYWEDEEIIPDEPKKILLGWLAYVKTNHEKTIINIMGNIKLFFGYEFYSASDFVEFLYESVYGSEYFKLICDNLRDK